MPRLIFTHGVIQGKEAMMDGGGQNVVLGLRLQGPTMEVLSRVMMSEGGTPG